MANTSCCDVVSARNNYLYDFICSQSKQAFFHLMWYDTLTHYCSSYIPYSLWGGEIECSILQSWQYTMQRRHQKVWQYHTPVVAGGISCNWMLPFTLWVGNKVEKRDHIKHSENCKFVKKSLHRLILELLSVHPHHCLLVVTNERNAQKCIQVTILY